MIERGEHASVATIATDRLSTDEFNEVLTGYIGERGSLAELHAERSRHLIEGAETAEAIRRSSGEVTDYINGLATEMYLRYSEQGKSDEEIAELIDSFIATETQTLLGDMADRRSDAAARHNRFLPSFMNKWYDRAVTTWQSWEVPAGDGELVSRMRNTEMWQHLEQRFDGQSTKRAKVGRIALVAASSAVNGIENLFRYSGARKRMAAMIAVGAAAGAASGFVLGAAGVGAAGAVAGGLVARTSIRSGLMNKLNSDAQIGERAAHDQARLQLQLDQLMADEKGYTVDELLGYVETETEKMLHRNNVTLLSGMAIGLASGLVGNTAARGMGWLSQQWVEANFGTPAYADTISMRVDADGGSSRSVNITTVSNGEHTDIVTVGGGASTDITEVSAEGKDHVDITTVSGNEHVDITAVTGLDTHSDITAVSGNDHIDITTVSGGDHIDITTVSGGEHSDVTTVEHEPASGTFMVEHGHGYVHELREAARANGVEMSAEQAWEAHQKIVDTVGRDYIDLVEHDGADVYSMGHSVYETGISAPGEATWSGEAQPLIADATDDGVINGSTGHSVTTTETHSDVTDVATTPDSVTTTETHTDVTTVDVEPVLTDQDWAKIDTMLERAADNDLLSSLSHYDQATMDQVGHLLQGSLYSDGTPVVSLDNYGHWTFNDNVEALPQSALSKIRAFLDTNSEVREKVTRLTSVV
jgi:hypothetical protein